MFGFFPLGAVCSLYPQVTRCKSSYTTVVKNDTDLVNVMILLGNISVLSVFLSGFLFSSLPPHYFSPSTTVCVCYLCVLCVLTLQRKTFFAEPHSLLR